MTAERTLAPPAAAGPWEVTFLHRARPGRAPCVGGLTRVVADSASGAREVAEREMARAAAGAPGWSLGVLRPLAPALTGAHLYEVTFAAWIEEAAVYRREEVFACAVWATDAESARRIAAQRAQASEGYRGSWRIVRVTRTTSGGGPARRRGLSAPLRGPPS